MDPQLHDGARRPSKWGDGNLIALLSLKLLLLAFFILLNARSSYEAIKVEAVLESVDKAFKGRVAVQENLSAQSAAVGPLADAAYFLDRVGRLFESMLPAVHRENTPRGPMMILELSKNAVFRAGESRLQPGRHLLLDRLAEALAAERSQALNYRVELLHGLGSAQDVARRLAAERVANLARQLAARGVPEERLSVGTYRSDHERVRFVLWILEPSSKSPASATASSEATVQ